MWKKFWEFAKKIDDLQRNFVQPTLSNLRTPTQAISNPATRWQSSSLDSRKTLLISTLTKVLQVCISKTYISKQS